jgi:BirA family biotin operon repressor/biotin-[acetyl-CoA-carboxylase] ligase
VINTSYQTAGKGQGDNSWISEPGKNITLSLILHPGFLAAGDQFLLNKGVTLGVCDFLDQYGIRSLIKWPNDIYVAGKKIGGILITHRVIGNRIAVTIAGIGININQDLFPSHIPNPTSLALETGKVQDILEARKEFLKCADKRYQKLKSGESEKVARDYCERLIGAGKWLVYRAGTLDIEGMIRDVDPFGRLIVEFRDGTKRIFSHQEISYTSFQT